MIALAWAGVEANAQLRVVAWNITNYSGGRTADIQTSVYGVFQSRSMAPDLIMTQEFVSQAGVNGFLIALNTAAGSPGDWAAAPFVNGPDTDSAFFYRTSKVDFLGYRIISAGGSSPNPPRNTMRYDIRLKDYTLKDYTATSANLACYSTHMKAQDSGGDDDARRLLEAQRIRDNAEGVDTNGTGTGLPTGWSFLVGGDTNIQNSASQEYQELVGSQTNNAGRFFDPINTPGSWNNNQAFRFVHTQDPIGAGGMDDRHDQILVCEALVDGQGFEYLGNSLIPYSTTTWDDPNHSYRSWGNDGTSYNTSLTITGNTMVGAAIAQALVNVANGGGHLPVFLDLRVPPKIMSATIIDFGQVPQDAVAQQTITVSNSADVALWNASGIADLLYSLSASADFTAPSGDFVAEAGAPGNDHVIEMSTATIGPKSGTLTVSSNAPDEPSRLVVLTGEVISACNGCDVDCDHQLAAADVTAFVNLLLDPSATPCSACAGDANGDGGIDGRDIQSFVSCLLGSG
jgi:hypothetical protein